MHPHHLQITLFKRFPQSSATAGPGAGPLCSRGHYTWGRIVQVPSLRFYGGLSPEWPRRDSLCSLAYVDKHFVWSMSGVLLVGVGVILFSATRLPGRSILSHRTADFACLLWVSLCAFKQTQMNSYHEDTASIRSCCSRLPRV